MATEAKNLINTLLIAKKVALINFLWGGFCYTFGFLLLAEIHNCV